MRSRLQAARWGTSLLASAMLATLLVLAPTPTRGPTTDPSLEPAAGTVYHCSGYKGCKQAGYSHAGYKKASKNMYWRMYKGHNCTNYVAYRMVKAGMPNARPWSGGGNASEWGKAMASITDQTPNVGAVAWWGRYSNGSGSAGHVAYVERVISPDQIVISEDSWGGTFHWRTIHRSSGRWPTGFIHFVDKVIGGTGAPVISGTTEVGATLTASTGTWSGGPTTFGFQWYADGVAIPGATAASYVVAGELLGKRLTVQVSAGKPGATNGVQNSAPTAPIGTGGFTMTQPPVVSGEMVVDTTLTVSGAAWSPAPTETVYKWFVDGVRDYAATTNRFTLTRPLVGRRIGLRVVAKQAGFEKYPSQVYELGQVHAGTLTAPVAPTVIGTPVVGEVLSVTPPTVSPADAAVTYRWMRNGAPIDAATGSTYQLAPADLGATVGVEVTATKPQFLTWTSVVNSAAPVTSLPQVAVTTKGKRGRAVVKVRVNAAGAAAVTGRVEVKIGSKVERAKLVNGVAKVSIRAGAGKRTVKVGYLGSPLVPASSTVKESVRIR